VEGRVVDLPLYWILVSDFNRNHWGMGLARTCGQRESRGCSAGAGGGRRVQVGEGAHLFCLAALERMTLVRKVLLEGMTL
jgi:hypothetical protein